ncbi:MAG: type IV secretion system DNA-binding domain-containing protein [Smithellaceae bacterium]|jgi:type IV secretory pathway TraG/TraD family ATPase VirD4
MDNKHNKKAFKGFETWLSFFQMNMKMFKWILIASVLFSAVFTLIIIFHLGDRDFYFFKIPSDRFWQISGWCLENMWWGLINNTMKVFQPAWDIFWQEFFQLLPFYLAIFFIILTLITVCTLHYFRKRSLKQEEEKYIDGAKFISSGKLLKLLSEKETSIPIADIKTPVDDETKHFFIVGRTGSGKTQTLKRVVTHLQTSGSKIILYDSKGDYIPTNYDEERDIIFNPIDERSARWTIFNDCTSKMDIEQVICHGMIPGSGGSRDPFWANASREVFRGILYYCYRNKMYSNAHIWDVLSAGASKIVKILNTIPEGRTGTEMILDSSSKQTQGIMAMLLQYTAILELMATEDGAFSIRKWLHDPKPGTLFLVNHSKSKDILKPILTLLLEMASHEVLSMPDDYQRRIYFFLDEFGSLNNMSSIIELLTRARSKGASVWIGTQEIGQIEKVYGKESRQSIVNGCASKLILSIAEPETAKYFSEAIGQTEVLESSESMSMGPSNIREGLTFTRTPKTKPLVLPSVFQQFPDMEGILKLSNYDYCKVKVPYVSYPVSNKYLKIRNDMLLESLIKKVDLYKKTIEDAGDVIFGADERINKSDKPRGQLDISFNN